MLAEYRRQAIFLSPCSHRCLNSSSQKLGLTGVSKVHHQKRHGDGDELTGEVGSLVAAGVLDGDGGQGLDLGLLPALGYAFQGRVTVFVVQVDGEVLGLGLLYFSRPAKLVLLAILGPGNLKRSNKKQSAKLLLFL